MKLWIVFSLCCAVVCASICAACSGNVPSGMAIPQNQNLVAVEYFSEGQPTGCGLRATGETRDDLWLNVSDHRVPERHRRDIRCHQGGCQEGKHERWRPCAAGRQDDFSDLGKIHKAWIKSDSGRQALVYKNGESSHSDAYMVNTEFASTVDMLNAMAQERFRSV